jgi:hypothetical protein
MAGIWKFIIVITRPCKLLLLIWSDSTYIVPLISLVSQSMFIDGMLRWRLAGVNRSNAKHLRTNWIIFSSVIWFYSSCTISFGVPTGWPLTNLICSYIISDVRSTCMRCNSSYIRIGETGVRARFFGTTIVDIIIHVLFIKCWMRVLFIVDASDNVCLSSMIALSSASSAAMGVIDWVHNLLLGLHTQAPLNKVINIGTPIVSLL